MFASSLWRTTTFRLTSLFGAVFAIAIVLLLGLIYFQTAGYLSARVDRALSAEIRVFGSSRPETILQRFQQETSRDPLNSFCLFSQTGEKVAGDAQCDPANVPADGKSHDLPRRPGMGSRRALAARMPWGEVLVAARDTSQLMALRRIVLNALLWSGVLIAILGLGTAVALSARPLRRIRSMQSATERIISGDLSTRLPVDGRRDELDQLAALVNRMMDEVERLIIQTRSVGESVAHELRTPLTRIRAVLEHASQEVDDKAPAGRLLEQCITDVDGVLARFRALLRIAAVEARGRRLGIQPVSLAAIVEQVVELYAPLAAEREVSLAISGGESSLDIRADGELLFEALSNLVDNAIKFARVGGAVRIRTSVESDAPTVEITDDGPGILESERSLVTRRFYRSQRDRHVEGHGLGLSLVAAVADLHGFAFSIHDAAPGTTVKLVCRGPDDRGEPDGTVTVRKFSLPGRPSANRPPSSRPPAGLAGRATSSLPREPAQG